MSPNLSMALRYAATFAVAYASGRGWLTPDQAGPITDALITIGGVVVGMLPAVYAGLKIDNGPKKDGH